MAEELIINVGVGGDSVSKLATDIDKLGTEVTDTAKAYDKLENSTDKLSKTSTKTGNEIYKLRKELFAAKAAMAQAEVGTEAYNKALARATQIATKQKEINDYIKGGIRDIGAMSKNVAGIVNGFGGAFSVAQGTMALFGVENDAVLKTMMQMQAVMSITQGIAGFANGFDDLQDLMTGFRAQSEGAKDAVNELSKVSGEAASNMSNIAKEGAVIGSNLAGTAGVVGGVNNKFADITETLNTFTKSQIDADIALIKSGKDFDSLSYSSNKYLATLGENITEEDILLEKLQEKSDFLKQVETNTDKATKATDKATNSLKSQLLTMGLWIAAIAVATFAIISLIEWMNKVPEDLKVKIDVETDVFKALGKDLININKFVNDYRKASKDGNKERLEELEKFGKKEYDLNDTRLKQIRDTTDGWKSAFKEYLKIAEDTYWNESIIKRKVEAQQAAITAKSTAIQLFKSQSGTGFMSGKTAQSGFSAKTSGGWTWKQLVEAAQKNNWAGKTDADLRAFGIPQQIIDELRKVILSNEIIKGLPKLRDVDMGTGKITPTTGNKTFKINIKNLPAVEQAKLEADAIAKIEEERIKLQIENNNDLTYEESEYRSQLSGIKNKFFNNDYFNESKYLKAINDARLLDLELQRQQLVEKQFLLKDSSKLYVLNEDVIQRQVQLINKEIQERNDLNEILVIDKNTRVELQAKLDAIISKEYKTLKEKTDAEKEAIIIKSEINDLDTNYIQVNEKLIKSQDDKIKSYNEELEKLKTKRDTFSKDSQEYIDITRQIEDVDTARLQALNDNTQIELDLWQKKIDKAGEYLDALSTVASGFSDLSQGNMDLINAEYDRQQWNIEETISNQEDKNKQLEAIDMERWQALQKDFENQKKWKEAQAWMDFASGSVKIWTGVNASAGIAGGILSGIQQAALLATTIGNVKTIRAQQMLKPHKSGDSASSNSGSGANIALNPSKDSLTSKEENLNTMAAANIKNAPTSVVKVSEINEVQSKVKVRESNSTF